MEPEAAASGSGETLSSSFGSQGDSSGSSVISSQSSDCSKPLCVWGFFSSFMWDFSSYSAFPLLYIGVSVAFSAALFSSSRSAKLTVSSGRSSSHNGSSTGTLCISFGRGSSSSFIACSDTADTFCSQAVGRPAGITSGAGISISSKVRRSFGTWIVSYCCSNSSARASVSSFSSLFFS